MKYIISQHYICIFYLIFLIPSAVAQEIITYDSVLAWKISTHNRIIYLVGERHNFHSIPDNINISHQLGTDIFNKSTTAYVEQKQNLRNGNNLKISQTVSSVLWQNIQNNVTNTISKSKTLSIKEKEKISINIINDIDNSSPLGAYASISALKVLEHNIKNNSKHVSGFSQQLKKIKVTHKKILPIEDIDSISKAWFANCSSGNDTELILNTLIEKTNYDLSAYITSINDSQTEFLLATKKNIDYSKKLKTNDSITNAIIEKCTIIPRNYSWMDKLKNDIQLQKDPILIVVGIDHILGEHGLLSLFIKMGFTDFKQIHTLD